MSERGLCDGCLTEVLIQSLDSATKTIKKLRRELAEQKKIASDSVADLYAMQEQLQLERTRKS